MTALAERSVNAREVRSKCSPSPSVGRQEGTAPKKLNFGSPGESVPSPNCYFYDPLPTAKVAESERNLELKEQLQAVETQVVQSRIEIGGLKREIDTLKAEIANLRTSLQQSRKAAAEAHIFENVVE